MGIEPKTCGFFELAIFCPYFILFRSTNVNPK